MICTRALTYTDKISKDLNFNKLNFAILDFLGILFWYISFGAGRGPNYEVTFLAGASPQHRIALLAHKPYPSPDDVLSGVGYAWVKFMHFFQRRILKLR